MFNKFINFFIESYSSDSLLIQKKAKALLITDLICVIGSIAYLISIFFTSFNVSQFIGFSVVIVAIIFSMIFLKNNKFEIAGNITIIFTLLCLMVPPFSVKPESIYQQYNIAFTQILVFFIAFLFTYRNYQLLIVYILGLTSQIVFYFMVTLTIATDNIGLRMNIISGSIMIYSFGFFLTFYINRVFLDVIRGTQKSAIENGEKFNNLDKLISSLTNGFEIGQKLISSTDVTVEAISQINSKISDIKIDMNSLGNEIKRSAGANKDILNQTTDLKEVICNQNSSIKESNDSINEITKTINHITEKSIAKKEVIKKLTQTAESGEKEVNLSIASMNNLTKNANDILDILNVIGSISGRTNLLAMNAAIEAAHAGESGRGFSIVAGEIRKLAENTNSNTKIISQTLSKNSEDIKNAFTINKRVGEYFTKINNEIKDLAVAIDEILSSIRELFDRMNIIKNNSNDMKEISTNSETSVLKIEEMNRENNKTINSVSDFMTKISRMFEDIVDGAGEILNETKQISEIGLLNIKYIENFSEKIKSIKGME